MPRKEIETEFGLGSDLPKKTIVVNSLKVGLVGSSAFLFDPVLSFIVIPWTDDLESEGEPFLLRVNDDPDAIAEMGKMLLFFSKNMKRRTAQNFRNNA